MSEDHAATPREESSLLEEVPSRSTASISDEVEASATAATDMKTESQVHGHALPLGAARWQ